MKRKMHPNSLKNLVLFKKGESGNPKGSSEKQARKTAIRREVEQLREKLGEYDNFDNDKRKAYWEFMRSLPPNIFAKAESDPDIPIGALVDAKALRSDLTEGSTHNTDRIEKQIYGNRSSVAVSGGIETSGPIGLNGIGFVFGGEDLQADEEETEDGEGQD